LVATQRPFPSRNGDIIGQKRDDRSPQLGEHTDAARLSTIPVTKNDSEHIVPLSDTALAVLTEIGLEPGEPVFPNNRGGLLSATAMAAVIRRMNEERKREGKPQWIDPKQGYRQVLPHGFRATFRTWVDEQTNFSRELGEKALAHTVGDETERSYQRGELLAKAQAVDECMGRALRRGQSAGGEQRHATARDCWQNKYVEHQ
jgi:integrase